MSVRAQCVCVCVFMMSSTNLGNCWELAILEKCYQNGQHRYRQTHVLPIRTTQIQNTDAQAAVVQIQIYVCTYVCMTIGCLYTNMYVADDERKKKARRKIQQKKDGKNARRHLLPLLLAAADQVGASCSGGGVIHWGKMHTAPLQWSSPYLIFSHDNLMRLRSNIVELR